LFIMKRAAPSLYVEDLAGRRRRTPVEIDLWPPTVAFGYSLAAIGQAFAVRKRPAQGSSGANGWPVHESGWRASPRRRACASAAWLGRIRCRRSASTTGCPAWTRRAPALAPAARQGARSARGFTRPGAIAACRRDRRMESDGLAILTRFRRDATVARGMCASGDLGLSRPAGP
jgi:hypothetical protein